MDKKFLHKVIDQIVSETNIDYDKKKIYFPFSSTSLSFPDHYYFHFYSFPTHFSVSFSDHCKDVYGLNKYEVKYVWKEYREIIKEKLNNGL